MQTNEIKKEQKQTTKKNESFVALKDLTPEMVSTFQKVPVRFSRTERKNGAGFLTSINIKLFDDFLTDLRIAPGGNYLTVDRFDLITSVIKLPKTDERGRLLSEWVRNVPVRFVKGKYEDGTDYLSLEIIYKQYYYDTHFFSSDQRRLIEFKESDGLKINWYERTESIIKNVNSDLILDLEF